MKLKLDRKKVIPVIVVLAACLVLLSIFGGKTREKEDMYRTARVRKADLRSVISATGTLKATETVDVGTQISGKIVELHVDYNSVVKKGQLIAKMDSSTQTTDMLAAQANYLAAGADLDASLARLEKAEKDYKRSKELAEQDLIAKTEFDSSVSSLKTAQADVAVSKAKINQTRQSLNKAKITLGYTYIYAPVDGVVVAKNVEEGQTVAASYSTPSIVEIARDLTKMQVEIRVDEADIGNVKDGQPAEFTVDSFPERKYFGKVTQIRLSPTTTDNVVTYTVVADVDNTDLSLLPGMSANVSLILKETKDTLSVPNSAFRFKPIDKSKKSQNMQGGPGMRPKANIAEVAKPSVYVIENGKPVKREVEKGITDGERTEIKNGLKEGERVITGVNLKKEG